jgi:hypothetical protein
MRNVGTCHVVPYMAGKEWEWILRIGRVLPARAKFNQSGGHHHHHHVIVYQ